MRRLTVLLAATVVLGACTPMVSSIRPLLARGDLHPRPGLWALLDRGCKPPASSRVESWPECATPVWLSDASATLLAPSPKRVRYVIARGSPGLVQVTGSTKEMLSRGERPETPGYSYFAIAPHARAPRFIVARVWELSCPQPDKLASTGLAAGPEGTCLAPDLATLQAVARGGHEGQSWEAVWVAER